MVTLNNLEVGSGEVREDIFLKFCRNHSRYQAMVLRTAALSTDLLLKIIEAHPDRIN